MLQGRGQPQPYLGLPSAGRWLVLLGWQPLCVARRSSGQGGVQRLAEPELPRWSDALRHLEPPVVDELLRMQPEIAAIPEMWHEKGAILDLLNQRSGSVWAFATGGATEQFNDADILFRTDKWEHIASDLVPFSAGRAINWAALRRKSDGYSLIASGTHPLCCQGDYVITEAVDFVTKTLSQVQNRHPYPIVLMGDLNTGYFQPSQQLLRQGQVEAFGRHWQIPMTFTDAWAELHPGNPDPSTINDDPVRLDYVYFQKTPFSVGQSIVQSQIWPRAAGSDHRAVSGDVVLNR